MPKKNMKPDEIDKLMKQVHDLKIKPCPFCGNQPIFSAHENRIFCPQHDRCPGPSTGYFGRWSDLLEEWNRRDNGKKKKRSKDGRCIK